MASRHDKDKGVNVQVLLRCRPFNEDELRANAPQVISCHDLRREVTVYQNIASKQIDRTFTFDKVFGPNSQQKDLYDQAVVPIVNEVLEGFNCTIFAYGQTGTGKTYTMEGAGRKAKSGELPADAGVIPRAIQQIFDTLESQNAEYSVKVTFLELYNEEITDLLAPEELSKVMDDKQRKPLALMEDGKGGVLVRGLEEEIVTSANEIYSLLDRGSAKRRTAETFLNKQSSRSHSIFSITIHIKEATPEGEELIKCGKLNLVDLAGSENISRSGAREGRAREAGEINKSLLTLGRVITALVEHLGHIPYRDSKLTRLLRDSLGGRTKTCIIATVSPSVHCLEETLSTLDYAHRAKNIKNKPEVNQKMMKSCLIKDLYGEIERLKSEVYAAREKNGIYVPRERYYQDEADKKAASDRIEHMEYEIEVKDKQLDDMQQLCDAREQRNTELQSKLGTTQKKLEDTVDTLAEVRESLKQAENAIKGRDYVISCKQEAENALVQQAYTLRSHLDTAAKDIHGLFGKIERKDNMESANHKLVGRFEEDLSGNLSSLNGTVTLFVHQQQSQLQALQQQLSSFMSSRDESIGDLQARVRDLKSTCCSRLQSLNEFVRDHEEKCVTTLDTIHSTASNDSSALQNLLSSITTQAEEAVSNFQSHLTEQQREMAVFAQQQREVVRRNADAASAVLTAILAFCGKLQGDVAQLGQYLDDSHRSREQSLSALCIDFEEGTRKEEIHLQNEIAALVAASLARARQTVVGQISSVREASTKDVNLLKSGLDAARSMVSETEEQMSLRTKEADANALESSATLAAGHCRMEELLQRCVRDTESTAEVWHSSLDSVRQLERKQLPVLTAMINEGREASRLLLSTLEETNASAQDEIAAYDDNISTFTTNIHAAEKEALLSVQSNIGTHCSAMEQLGTCHGNAVKEMETNARVQLRDEYMEDVPTCTTPKSRPVDIPTTGRIEQLRAPQTELLLDEFQAQHKKQEEGMQENASSKMTTDKQQLQLQLQQRETRIPLTTFNRLEQS